MAVIAGFVVLLILGAGLFCWTLALFKLVVGQPLVEWSSRRPVPWALLDLAGMVALYLAVNVIAAYVLREFGLLPQRVELDKLGFHERMTLTLVNAILSLLVVGVGLPLIALRTSSTLADFGWSARELLDDIKLGAIAFVMLAPPVYAIQAILTQLWPSKHPIMEMFRTAPDPVLFAVLFFAAVVVAPIAEEILFRVLLQGFLEKVFAHKGPVHALLLGSPTLEGPPAPEHSAWDSHLTELPSALPPWPATVESQNPYQPPRGLIGDGNDDLRTIAAPVGSRPPRGAAAWMPIALSSLIFALLHNWPDVIALIPLAVGMGYLYHRTHRLVPSLTVHALLNGLSMVGLWITVVEAPNV